VVIGPIDTVTFNARKRQHWLAAAVARRAPPTLVFIQLARKLMSRRMAIGAIASRAGPANGVASS
jgi:hypothetical protein